MAKPLPSPFYLFLRLFLFVNIPPSGNRSVRQPYYHYHCYYKNRFPKTPPFLSIWVSSRGERARHVGPSGSTDASDEAASSRSPRWGLHPFPSPHSWSLRVARLDAGTRGVKTMPHGSYFSCQLMSKTKTKSRAGHSD